MHYTYYKRYNPEDVLVYIEEFDKTNGIIVFDFFDSNEYELFTQFGGLSYSLQNPSMVLIQNYRNKTIQENTIYVIKRNVIDNWREQNLIVSNNENSFIIGYSITLKTNSQIFFEPVSIDEFAGFFLNIYMKGGGDVNLLGMKVTGKLSVTVRDVGQGNWNEINEENKTEIVFDAGAPMSAARADIRRIIGNRAIKYSKDKPGLILSHWDKDHYHSLVGMSDAELGNFSFFICRDRVPNLTSRILFGRISMAIGSVNTYTISAPIKAIRGGPTRLFPLLPITNQFVIYNAQHHKNRNISGLVISLKTGNSSIILSGDCHYGQISMDILPHLNFKHKHHLVVPHHGGKAGKYIYNLPTHAIPEKAIISVGANRYGHPLPSYIKDLTLGRFKIQKTQTVSKDIQINL